MAELAPPTQVVGLRRGAHREAETDLQDRLHDARSAAARAHRLHGGRREAPSLETLPGLADLLPGGALRAGSAYSVTNSTILAMALLAGPSAAGAWCGVVGLPSLGVEATAGLGVDLDRLVLVPDPGAEWLNVVAALVGVLGVVAVRPPGPVSDGEAARIGARLRVSDAVLVSCGRWPQSEARLSVAESSWFGVGAGHGHLTARLATVVVQGRGTAVRPRRSRLWLPDSEGRVRVAEELAQPASPEPGWAQEAAG